MSLQPNPIFHNLSHRTELGAFLNARGLTGKGVEVGTLFGAHATDILKTWKGHLYCVDPWLNQDEAVYNDGANREHDMNRVFAAFQNGIGRHERCTGLRMYSLNATGKFEDGELDFVYLDGNHAVDAVRADIAAWWPKVKIGGILCGHDHFTRYDRDTNSDALTAVCELSEALRIRVHATWCSSWYFEKTAEADLRFRDACIPDRESKYSLGLTRPMLPRPVYTENSSLDNCVVVLPVARFDWNLACKWLTWAAAMRSPSSAPIIAWCGSDVDEIQYDALRAAGPANLVIVDSGVKELGYFGTPNQMFRTALEYCEREFPARAILWCEADTVPTRATWVEEIMSEYRACGRPFMGDVERNGGIPHLTGNAVYHPDWRRLAPSLAALGSEACGWDSLCAHDILPRAHYAKTIRQVWRPPLPITDLWAKTNIRPETALFHQCKDGSLIDVLCLRDGLPLIPLAPALCESTYENDKHKLAPTGPAGSVVAKTFAPPAPVRPTGGCEIMVTACRRDAEFFGFCLKSLELYASGFSGITLVVPAQDARHFQKFDGRVKLITFDEHPTKGFLHHEIMVLRADEICRSADYILHIDPDVLMWKPTSPSDLIKDGRCLMVRERYDDIASRNANRLIWRKCVESATGIFPEFETMVRHCNIYPKSLYPRVRAVVERHVGNDFDSYVMSCENGFPQSFCEYCTAGAIAIRDFSEKFNFIEYDHGRDARELGIPGETTFQYAYRLERDHFVEYWSHSGVGRYRSQIDAVLAGKPPSFFLK